MIFALLLLAAELPCVHVKPILRASQERIFVQAVNLCKTYLPASYVRLLFEPQGIVSMIPMYGAAPGKCVRVPVGAEAFRSVRAVSVVSTIEEALR